MRLSKDVGVIHFVGIGGIGMSGIAEVMHNLGYKVQGSDLNINLNVERLRKHGIKVSIGHSEENLDEAKIIVISSAVKMDNPEVSAARKRFIPVVRRAEMLAELMRFKSCIAVGGTHGKTTTTSMVAAVLDGGGFDPTVINGGIINAYGTNTRMGDGDWMVVEADESDGTFIKLPSEIAIVTNIDPEHLDYYGDFTKLREAFLSFVENVPFYGFAVMCIDHPEVQALVGRIRDRRIITYGKNPQAEVRLVSSEYISGNNELKIEVKDRITGHVEFIDDIKLPMPGEHNALNATAVIAVARELEIPIDNIINSLQKFAGVKRRFTKTGTWQNIDVFDDYAHHPTEINAVLKAARKVTSKRVIAVVQPHRYSRLKDLFSDFCGCFNDADIVIVAPVYSAGEEEIEGFNNHTLVDELTARGHLCALIINEEKDLAPLIKEKAEEGDIIICMGAGNITYWANSLPDELKRLDSDQ